MTNIPATTYLTYAEARLREAGTRCVRVMPDGYATNLGELAVVASLTWDGAMYILSALATLDGETITGRSSDLHQYARHTLPQADFALWSYLAKLHNFQHKPNHPEAAFRESCRETATLLSILNSRLPPSLQLSEACREWLAAL